MNTPSEIKEKLERRPLDYLKIFFRRKWLIIIPVIIGIIGGVIAINTLPKVYQASTLILVEESRVMNPLIQGLAVSTSVAQRLTVLREQILGWDRINQLIKKLNLAKDVRSQWEFEQLVKRLRSSINVKLYGHNIIGISNQDKNPGQAMNIVRTITDIFIEENLRQQNRESENAIAFINNELALFQKKIKQSEISEMEDQLQKLLIDSTDKHPMVIELRKKIETAKTELAEGNYDVSPTSVAKSDSELKELREELSQLREEMVSSQTDSSEGEGNRIRVASNTNEKIYKLLLLERLDNVAKEDANVNRRLYNVLLERLETAKITQRLEASKEGTRYTILDPARHPLKPVKPNKFAVLMLGAFIGLCGGVGLVSVVELLDHSFLSVDEAKKYFDLPMLGATSRIITHDDLKVQKSHNIKITIISIAIGVLLLIVIIFNLLSG